MPRKTKLEVILTEDEKHELESWQRSTTKKAGLVKRSKIILLRAQGVPVLRIAQQIQMRRRHVGKWIKRFLELRIKGLCDKAGRGRKPFFSARGSDPSGQTCLRTA